MAAIDPTSSQMPLKSLSFFSRVNWRENRECNAKDLDRQPHAELHARIRTDHPKQRHPREECVGGGRGQNPKGANTATEDIHLYIHERAFDLPKDCHIRRRSVMCPDNLIISTEGVAEEHSPLRPLNSSSIGGTACNAVSEILYDRIHFKEAQNSELFKREFALDKNLNIMMIIFVEGNWSMIAFEFRSLRRPSTNKRSLSLSRRETGDHCRDEVDGRNRDHHSVGDSNANGQADAKKSIWLSLQCP
ncbi:hypothetical protein CAPTEDRAFT_210376 [Capitella teleta]|uniref:Uncharacterized protein n=1 Tax=Capitella teleta TaxID=283909 RepID=N1PB20_CAPTE|nr:hypothetical protein CAPTEDRAFT_210376 [Capitella teleta]|eukprot:ELU18898.1 hypothetical protein CAPTEDRAFT_210376 [Capitella teleta]